MSQSWPQNVDVLGFIAHLILAPYIFKSFCGIELLCKSSFFPQYVLLESVQSKLKILKAGLLKGGYRYVNLPLKVTNPTLPTPFIVWESKVRGLQEQVLPKREYWRYMQCNAMQCNAMQCNAMQ